MKKITLALLIALGLHNFGYGQANVSLQAPQYDGSSTGLSLANGMAAGVYHRSCFLVLQSELTGLALTNSIVTSIGFDLTQGCNVATTGQYTVYLENTSDVTYTKGQNWATILTGMSINYQGAMTLPVNTGFTTVTLPLSSSFTYTGGGIYVACEWFAAAPTATLPARTQCNSTGLTLPANIGAGCYASASLAPAPAILTNTETFRPCYRFTAANTATNEVSITAVNAFGKVSKLFTAGHSVLAQIRNNSNAQMTNVAVTLSIGGTNPFTNTQTVTTIGAGSFATVVFDPYLPTQVGASTMTISVPNDQNNSNNIGLWSQSVTCSDFSYIPPIPAASFNSSAYGWNNTVGGIYSWRMVPPSGASLSAMSMVVASGTAVPGNSMYGVLMDVGGTILATSNTVVLTAAMQNNVALFNFNPPVALTANTPYLFGMAQPVSANAYFPFANLQVADFVPNFYLSPIAGGSANNADRGYIAIGAVLSFSNTSLTAMASKTIVCKKDGPNTVTLTASGLSTYTWAPGGTNGTVVVSPTLSANAGVVNYSVSGTDAASGCKTPNQTVITISVSACTAISSNTSDDFNINLFPNPAVGGKSTINGLVGTNRITAVNALGQIVLSQTVTEESTTLDLSSFPSGTYMVKITNSNSQTRLIKVTTQN